MSFNKNNPNAVEKLMGYLKQLSTEMGGTEQSRRSNNDENRLYGRQRGSKYVRVPSRATLSASTTCTSLAESCGSQGILAPNYDAIPEHVSTESSSEDDQDTFEKTRLHFQQLRQISLGNEFKYKMEMEIKSAKGDNIRNATPFVKQLSTDSSKVKTDYAINGDSPPYAPTTQKIYIYTQLFVALAVSMGSLIGGFTAGYTSPALANMHSSLEFTDEEETWVGGLMPLAALIGGVAGGTLIEYVGRRVTIIGIAVPFLVGWLLIANALNIYMVLAGRALCGICVGVGSLAFPVYLGETVQPEVRGVLGLLPTAFGNIGILLAFAAGSYLNWSQLAFLGCALPIPFFFMMLFTPETPRWYISKDRAEDAKNALQKLRGKNFNIERELNDLAKSQSEANRAGGSIMRNLFASNYTRAVMISMALMVFQQLSGINAVVFYASKIFIMSGSGMDPNISSIIIGFVNFISTFIATGIIDRLGRKILLYISSVMMIVTLIALGVYFFLQDAGIDVKSFGWVPLASLVLYVLGFSIGFGPIPWLMLGEILPSKIRGTAAALASSLNWGFTFLVTKTFQNMVAVLHLYGTFWLFAAISLIGLFFVIFFVPETRGKSLEEIEKKLSGSSRKARNITGNKRNIC